PARPTTPICPRSLHDALPIYRVRHLAAGTTRGSVPQTLASVGVTPASAAFDLASLFAGGAGELERYSAGAQIQTDNRTALEYSRSEEHTSELQSLAYIVCRLL